MILPEKQATAIVDGRKTTVRVLVGTAKVVQRSRRVDAFPAPRRAYGPEQKTVPWEPKVGDRIAIRTTDGKPDAAPVAHITVLHVATELLGELTREDAAREGFAGARGIALFRRAWLERHDRAWIGETATTELGVTDEAVAERYTDRHAASHVHVLLIEVCERPDVFLAQPASGRGDYTGNPGRAIDPLPVPPSEFVDEIAKTKFEERRTALASFAQDLAAERFERARLKALAAGKDTAKAARAVNRIAAALERAVDDQEHEEAA